MQGKFPLWEPQSSPHHQVPCNDRITLTPLTPKAHLLHRNQHSWLLHLPQTNINYSCLLHSSLSLDMLPDLFQHHPSYCKKWMCTAFSTNTKQKPESAKAIRCLVWSKAPFHNLMRNFFFKSNWHIINLHPIPEDEGVAMKKNRQTCSDRNWTPIKANN